MSIKLIVGIKGGPGSGPNPGKGSRKSKKKRNSIRSAMQHNMAIRFGIIKASKEEKDALE